MSLTSAALLIMSFFCTTDRSWKLSKKVLSSDSLLSGASSGGSETVSSLAAKKKYNRNYKMCTIKTQLKNSFHKALEIRRCVGMKFNSFVNFDYHFLMKFWAALPLHLSLKTRRKVMKILHQNLKLNVTTRH